MSKNCSGLHCPGCGDGGGPAIAAGLVVLVLIVASARAIGRAVSEVVTVLAITAVTIAGVGIGLGSVAAVVMLRRRAIRRAQLRARELASAETLEWALGQIAVRDARPELPAGRIVPGESLAGYWERMEIKPRRSPR